MSALFAPLIRESASSVKKEPSHSQDNCLSPDNGLRRRTSASVRRKEDCEETRNWDESFLIEEPLATGVGDKEESFIVDDYYFEVSSSPRKSSTSNSDDDSYM